MSTVGCPTLPPRSAFAYFSAKLGERRARPQNDLLSALVAEEVDGELSGLLAGGRDRAAALDARERPRRPADRDAFRHWQRVTALVDPLPDTPETLALGVMARDAMLLHGLFLGMSDDEATALLRDGVALAERLPEPATPRVRLLLRLAARRSLTGAPEEARLHAEEALALADRSGNPLLQFLARFSLQGALVNRGRLREALERIVEADALCGGDPEFAAEFTGFSPYGAVLNNRATCLRMLGGGETGAREVERVIEIARARKDHDLLGWRISTRSAGARSTATRRARSPMGGRRSSPRKRPAPRRSAPPPRSRSAAPTSWAGSGATRSRPSRRRSPRTARVARG